MDFVIETRTHLWCGTFWVEPLAMLIEMIHFLFLFSFEGSMIICTKIAVVQEMWFWSLVKWMFLVGQQIFYCVIFYAILGSITTSPKSSWPFSHCWLNLGVDVQTDRSFLFSYEIQDLVTFVRACHQWFRCRTQLVLH